MRARSACYRPSRELRSRRGTPIDNQTAWAPARFTPHRPALTAANPAGSTTPHTQKTGGSCVTVTAIGAENAGGPYRRLKPTSAPCSITLNCRGHSKTTSTTPLESCKSSHATTRLGRRHPDAALHPAAAHHRTTLRNYSTDAPLWRYLARDRRLLRRVNDHRSTMGVHCLTTLGHGSVRNRHPTTHQAGSWNPA